MAHLLPADHWAGHLVGAAVAGSEAAAVAGTKGAVASVGTGAMMAEASGAGAGMPASSASTSLSAFAVVPSRLSGKFVVTSGSLMKGRVMGNMGSTDVETDMMGSPPGSGAISVMTGVSFFFSLSASLFMSSSAWKMEQDASMLMPKLRARLGRKRQVMCVTLSVFALFSIRKCRLFQRMEKLSDKSLFLFGVFAQVT